MMSHYQNVGQKHSIKLGNRSFEDVAKLKYLRITLTDQNCTHKEIKTRINLANACYHLIQGVFVFLPAVWEHKG
jgi:hypothetical protein